MSFAEYLAGLDAVALTALLEQRPDVLREPVPAGVAQLAQRLDAADSLSAALDRVDHDEVLVLRTVAVGAATLPALADDLRCPSARARAVVDGLAGRGLAWRLADRVGLPARLGAWLSGELSGFRPLAQIARQARLDELRTAVEALGGDPAGAPKAALTEQLAGLYADPDVVDRAVAALPQAARRHLDLIRTAGIIDFPYTPTATGPVATLVRAGLLVCTPYLPPELPREAAAAILRGTRQGLTGRPALPEATTAPDAGRAGGEGGLLALTTLLDEARHKPLAMLKKGGVGTRERNRLATRVGVPEPALWIDVAAAAGLLARVAGGYGPSDRYSAWREEAAARRWATVALAWFALQAAPTSRETDDGEVPPPLPLESSAGLIRRALLRAAVGGRSVQAAAGAIGWFCPLQPYDATGLQRKLAAATCEAELLGVVAGDRLTALGEELVAASSRPDAVHVLASACTALLPDARGLLVLQSDLTAVVSGQPTAAAARLLAEAATAESRGVAATWRFTPQSVRTALDRGWTAEELLGELAAISERPVPQPLEYLVGDVARRHGAVRVRGVQSCVTGSAAEVAEILATRSLRPLQLSPLAPTVLGSPLERDDLVAHLRKAGFMPMPEGADGAVVLPDRPETSARPVAQRAPQERRRVSAAELAARLAAAPEATEPPSPSNAQLAELAPHLDEAEVALLADALDRRRDVQIVYRNQAGNRSARVVRPEQLYGRWMVSWCHLRAAEREFTVSRIESVSLPSP
jgi:hypothetical protein